MGAVVLDMFPPKPEVFKRFRELGWVDVTLDSKASGVRLQSRKGVNYTRYFTIGWAPGVTVTIEADGVRCHDDYVPWTAIFLMESKETGERRLWRESMPAELIADSEKCEVARYILCKCTSTKQPRKA